MNLLNFDIYSQLEQVIKESPKIDINWIKKYVFKIDEEKNISRMNKIKKIFYEGY
jgi:hypothetical protein